MPTDITTGGATVELTTLDGRVISLQKLSPRSVAKFTNELRTQRRANLLSTLKEAGIAGDEMLKRLELFDSMPIFVTDLVDAIYDTERRYRALELAAEQSGVDAGQLNWPIGGDESLNAAARLFDYELVVKPKEGTPPPLTGPASAGSTDSGATPG